MFYGGKSRFEGLKAMLSIAAIAAGFALSDMAASPTGYLSSGPVDVVGVWQWVMQGEGQARHAAGPMFEIRRAEDGHLEALIKAGSGSRLLGADVRVDDGQVCMITRDGASFSGELSDDGRRIDGVIHYGGESSSAILKRVEHRKMRRAAGRKAYAT